MKALKWLTTLRKCEKQNIIFNPVNRNIVPELNKAITELRKLIKLSKIITEYYCDMNDTANEDAHVQEIKSLLGIK